MVIRVAPIERLSVVSFPREEDRLNPSKETARDSRLFEPIIYHCFDCGYDVEFTKEDFQKHFHSPYSNLSITDQAQIDELKTQSKEDRLSFLDFYCPSCRRAVCILFVGGIAGKGEFFVDIQDVLEIR